MRSRPVAIFARALPKINGCASSPL